MSRPTERSFRIPLRARAALAVAGTALLLTGVLGTFVYTGMRTALLDERQTSARRQADLNARAMRSDLRSPNVDPTESLGLLRVTPSGDALLVSADGTYSTRSGLDSRAIPAELLEGVLAGRAGQQRATVRGSLSLVTGVPIAEADAAYFEVTSLDPVTDALDAIAAPLVLASVAATLVGAVIGVAISGSVLRPVVTTSMLARRIADGDIAARLDVGRDPALLPLAESFNEMVDRLQARIDRETAFASNVSHELKGPLMALEHAVEQVDRQRKVLPDEAAVAVESLEDQVRSFNRLVLDLLEISRFDAGTAELVPRQVDLGGLVRVILDGRGDDIPVEEPDGSVKAVVDPRRMQQVLANLVDNAERYAGGATCVTVGRRDGWAYVAVDDAGPGVPPEEREQIFQRFERGTAGAALGSSSGTGLGLALALHHVELHGGTLRVDDGLDGGARFVVELPEEQP